MNQRTNKRQLIKERLKHHKKPGDSARLLNYWLSETETSVDLAHVLQSLQDNRKNSEQLPRCSELITKFTYKALQTNRAVDWLQAIEQLLQDYQNLGKVAPADLYISRFFCLKSLKYLHPEAEECLNKAIILSRDNVDKIKAYSVLLRYYENISKYNKMKEILLQCESLCAASNLEHDLAYTWVFLGHYYFRTFKFIKANKYFYKARLKMEYLLSQQQNYKELLRTLSNCLHFMGRIYFEEYELIKSAEFYVKAQTLLEEYCEQNSLTPDIGATAYYHLRLGQVLEAAQIKENAKYHYHKSRQLFIEHNADPSSLVHVNLALANLVVDKSSHLYYSKKTFHKEEKQIKDAANKALNTGYPRGYLMALTKLLTLYVKNRNFNLGIKVFLQILNSQEFQNLGGISFLIYYVFKIKIFYKIKVIFYKKIRVDKIIRFCPCSDPNCKSINQ
jgi:tetratricopeptide (TPR) repeat protein